MGSYQYQKRGCKEDRHTFFEWSQVIGQEAIGTNPNFRKHFTMHLQNEDSDRFWVTCPGCPYLNRLVDPDDLQISLLTSTIL